MIHVPRVEAAGRGTATRMNPISTLTGIAHDVLKAPFTLAGSALRLGRSVIGKSQHEPQHTAAQHAPSPPEPEVEITPDRPVNVTEELGLDPSPVAKPKRPRKQPTKPVTSIDAEADVSDVDVTPADVADAVAHRSSRATDE